MFSRRFFATIAFAAGLVVSSASISSATTLGQLDSSFGGVDGTIKASMGTDFRIRDMAIQPDGKILSVGLADSGQANFDHMFISRVNSDGTPDTNWGQTGILSLFPEPTAQGDSSDATAIALQPDGKIVVAGTAGSYPGNSHITVLRLTSTGQLDATFDSDGYAFLPLTNFNIVYDVLIQSDGHIVIIGANFNTNTNIYSWVVARFRSNGSLDTGFNTGGTPPGVFQMSNNSSTNVAFRGTLLLDGSLLVVGTYDNKQTVIKLSANGTLVSSFGTQGIGNTIFYGLEDDARDLFVTSDGKILTGGNAQLTANTHQPTLVRYNANGSPDASFGSNGIVTLSHIAGAQSAEMYRIEQLRDGRIVVTGRLMYRNVTPTRQDFALWLINENGTVDTTVYSSGVFVLSGGGTTSNGDYRMFALAIQSDDKVVVAGEAETQNNDQFLFRLNSMIPTVTPTTQAPATSTPVAASLTAAPSPLSYRAANKSVTLRWRAVEGATSYVVTTTTGTQRCATSATSCVVNRLRNGRAYNYLVYSVNADGVRSENSTRLTARPGFQVKRTTLKAKRSVKLSSIVTTPSKGAKTWRVTSGRCRISGTRLIAPPTKGTCKLRLATAKAGSYAAMSTTVNISVTR